MMRQRIPSLLRHVAPAIFAILASLAAYWVWWMPGVPAPGMDDLSQINAPQRMLLQWFYRHGMWPLWNPWSFGGQPFLSAGQSGPLYPPNILFVCLPIQTALRVSYSLHIMWGACGAYILMYALARSRIGAAAAAAAWMTSGPLLEHEIHTQMFEAACWLPWIVWLALRLLKGAGRGTMLALSACIAAQILCGHPQVTFMTALFVVVQCLLRCIPWSDRPRLGAVLRLGCAGLLGAALGAAQWAPTLDLTSYSSRIAQPVSFLLEGSLPPWVLLQWLIPLPFGGGYTGVPFHWANAVRFYIYNFWEVGCYVGVVVLLAAFVQLQRSVIHILNPAWRRLRERSSDAVSLKPVRQAEDLSRKADVETLRLGVAAILYTLLALGGWGPLTFVLTRVPGFDFFRDPGRYMLLADLCVAAIGGIAVRDWVRTGWSWRWRAVLGGWAAMVVLMLWLRVPRNPLAAAPVKALVVPAVLCALTVLAASLPTGSRLGRSLRPRGIVLAGLVMADALLWGASFSPYILWEPAAYLQPDAVVQYLSEHLSSEQPFIRAAGLDGALSISQDKALAYRIPVLNGEDSLVPWWYSDYVDLQWSDDVFLSQRRSLADALAVRYLVTPQGQAPFATTQLGTPDWQTTSPNFSDRPGWLRLTFRNPWPAVSEPVQIITRDPTGTHLYNWQANDGEATFELRLKPDELPMQVTVASDSWDSWMWLSEVEWTDARGRVIKTLHPNVQLSPKAWTPVFSANGQTVWRNPDPIAPAWEAPNANAPLYATADGTAKLVAFKPDAQCWQVNGDGGLLVVSQTYDPHWQATVDGRPAAIQRVAGLLTAVPVPPGRHTVMLRYHPVSLWIGLWISGCAAAGWILLCTRLTSDRFRAKRRA
jgi:hypothetical protein